MTDRMADRDIKAWMKRVNADLAELKRGRIRRPSGSSIPDPLSVNSLTVNNLSAGSASIDGSPVLHETHQFRVFSTKAELDAWTAPDGTVAYVSSENRHYVRSAGTWQVALEDTGWLPLTPAHPRFTVGDYAEYRIHGGFFSLRFRNVTVSASGTYNLFDVGEVGYNPGKTVRAPVAIDGTTAPNPAWVNPDGMLRSNWMTGQSYWMEHSFKL